MEISHLEDAVLDDVVGHRREAGLELVHKLHELDVLRQFHGDGSSCTGSAAVVVAAAVAAVARRQGANGDGGHPLHTVLAMVVMVLVMVVVMVAVVVPGRELIIIAGVGAG